MTELPWAALFGLMFMTMGPIRAIAVFSKIGESDATPDLRPAQCSGCCNWRLGCNSFTRRQ